VREKTLVAILLAVVRTSRGKWDMLDRAMDSAERTKRLALLLTVITMNTAALAVLAWVLTRR